MAKKTFVGTEQERLRALSTTIRSGLFPRLRILNPWVRLWPSFTFPKFTWEAGQNNRGGRAVSKEGVGGKIGFGVGSEDGVIGRVPWARVNPGIMDKSKVKGIFNFILFLHSDKQE